LPNLDKAFDKELITFKPNGQIIISKQLLNSSGIGIQKQIQINLLEGNQQYMEFHRNEVF
jgi:putative restriction endonuclease